MLPDAYRSRTTVAGTCLSNELLTANKQGHTILIVADMNEMNPSETTLNGVRAVVEVRWEDTRDGDVVELVYLVLFNERKEPLRVVFQDTDGILGPDGGYTEILVGYRYQTSTQSWKMPYVDTDVGRVTCDTDTFPPKVQIDPSHKLI